MREARSTVGAGGGGAAVVAFVNVPLVDVPLVVLLPLNITCSTQGLALGRLGNKIFKSIFTKISWNNVMNSGA